MNSLNQFLCIPPNAKSVFMNKEDENDKYSPTYIFWNFSYDLHISFFRDWSSCFGHNFSIHKHFACMMIVKTSNIFLFNIVTSFIAVKKIYIKQQTPDINLEIEVFKIIFKHQTLVTWIISNTYLVESMIV